MIESLLVLAIPWLKGALAVTVLVGVPVAALIGAWLALIAYMARKARGKW